MVRAEATAKYIRSSAQKAGLVLDLIRGKDVNLALSALQFSRKSVARDVAKVLRSAVANAQQQDAFGGDVARLFVSKCHANNGPSQKRVRPAPMGRAFRIVKRTTHLTVEVTERAQVIKAVPADGSSPTKKAGSSSETKQAARAAKPAKSTRAGAKKPAAAAAE
ncbi:MAG: 50S ribosomal protein L22 [Vicinamibacterales bacterium]